MQQPFATGGRIYNRLEEAGAVEEGRWAEGQSSTALLKGGKGEIICPRLATPARLCVVSLTIRGVHSLSTPSCVPSLSVPRRRAAAKLLPGQTAGCVHAAPVDWIVLRAPRRGHGSRLEESRK